MSLRYAAVALLILLFTWPYRAVGQTPLLVADPYPIIDAPVPLVPGPQPVVTPFDQAWSVDLVLGYPTGLRLQRAVGASHDWSVEGFAGVDVVFPMFGGGVRRRLTPLAAEYDCLQINPGLNAYLLYNTFHGSGWFSNGPSTIELFTLDADVIWQHHFSHRLAGELGFKIGGGPGFGARWGFVPVVGVFFGCRF